VVVLEQNPRYLFHNVVVLVVAEHILAWKDRLEVLQEIFLHQQHHIKLLVVLMDPLELLKVVAVVVLVVLVVMVLLVQDLAEMDEHSQNSLLRS
jgi:hypothetical protein